MAHYALDAPRAKITPMKIAIQGEIGSFHDAATRQFFNNTEYSLMCLPSFGRVFDALADKQADFGVVAVENSLFGSIHETYDQLLKHPLTIIGEVVLHIHQQLIAHDGVKLEDIKKVTSHPAALDQCRSFLQKHLPDAELVEHADTAGAVMDLAKSRDRSAAAIASDFAAKLYDMQIIAPDIEDEPDNVTRFIALSRSPEQDKSANKASLILTTPHQPGALYKALGIFTKNGCNMTKLESRPVRGKPFQYQFIVDAMTNQDQLISLVHELEQIGCQTTLLGHYKSAQQAPGLSNRH